MQEIVPIAGHYRQETIHQAHRQPRLCQWCRDVLEPGTDGLLCWPCRERATLDASQNASAVILIPRYPVATAGRALGVPRTVQVLGLIEEQGAVAQWTRPDVRDMARAMGCSTNAVYAALKHLVRLGWLERRELGSGKHAYASDYRLALVRR